MIWQFHFYRGRIVRDVAGLHRDERDCDDAAGFFKVTNAGFLENAISTFIAVR